MSLKIPSTHVIFYLCPANYWLWSNCLGKHNAKCLKTNTNIKKTIRKMLFKKSNHPTGFLFQKLNILVFEKLKLLKIGIFMWKVLNDIKVLQTLKDHFSIRERDYGYNNAKFHLPLANTNLFKQDVVYQGPKLWNSIPTNIKSKVSVPTLKIALKKHLVSNF